MRKQSESVQQRRALQDMTNQELSKASAAVAMMPGPEVPRLHLKPAQKVQLQQQMQQVGLLRPAHLWSEEVSLSEAVGFFLSAS